MPRQRANRAAYKARRKGAEGTFTAEDVNAQMRLQAGCCFWCHKNLATTFHIDHLIPLKQGGSNWPDNLVMACVPCNTSRKAKMPDEFREFLRITGRAPASL